MKPDKFASINTKQPTSFPQIPLPVVRKVGCGVGHGGAGAGTHKSVERPTAPQILTPPVEGDRKKAGGWGHKTRKKKKSQTMASMKWNRKQLKGCKEGWSGYSWNQPLKFRKPRKRGGKGRDNSQNRPLQP